MKLAKIQKNGQKMPRNRQKQIKIVKKWTKQAGAKLGQAQLARKDGKTGQAG